MARYVGIYAKSVTKTPNQRGYVYPETDRENSRASHSDWDIQIWGAASFAK